MKKLRELAGVEFLRHGGSHDVYVTRDGKRIEIPRHARDLGRGRDPTGAGAKWFEATKERLNPEAVRYVENVLAQPM